MCQPVPSSPPPPGSLNTSAWQLPGDTHQAPSQLPEDQHCPASSGVLLAMSLLQPEQQDGVKNQKGQALPPRGSVKVRGSSAPPKG